MEQYIEMSPNGSMRISRADVWIGGATVTADECQYTFVNTYSRAVRFIVINRRLNRLVACDNYGTQEYGEGQLARTAGEYLDRWSELKKGVIEEMLDIKFDEVVWLTDEK